MRFGLFDLDELPSLKEFEALAQAALGDDTGIAPTEPEDPAIAPEAAAEPAPGFIASSSNEPEAPVEPNANSTEGSANETDSARAAVASAGKGSSEQGT
jgi:hypothetical protein